MPRSRGLTQNKCMKCFVCWWYSCWPELRSMTWLHRKQQQYTLQQRMIVLPSVPLCSENTFIVMLSTMALTMVNHLHCSLSCLILYRVWKPDTTVLPWPCLMHDTTEKLYFERYLKQFGQIQHRHLVVPVPIFALTIYHFLGLLLQTNSSVLQILSSIFTGSCWWSDFTDLWTGLTRHWCLFVLVSYFCIVCFWSCG